MLTQFKTTKEEPIKKPTDDNEVVTGYFNDTVFGIVKYTLIKVFSGNEPQLPGSDEEPIKGFVYSLDLGVKYQSPVAFFFHSFVDAKDELQAEIRIITPLDADAQLLHPAIMKTIQAATLHIVPRIYNKTIKI